MTGDIMIHNHLIQLNSGVPRHRKNVIRRLLGFFFLNTATTAHIFSSVHEEQDFVCRSPEASVTAGSLRQVTGIRRQPVAAGSADPGYQ